MNGLMTPRRSDRVKSQQHAASPGTPTQSSTEQNQMRYCLRNKRENLNISTTECLKNAKSHRTGKTSTRRAHKTPLGKSLRDHTAWKGLQNNAACDQEQDNGKFDRLRQISQRALDRVEHTTDLAYEYSSLRESREHAAVMAKDASATSKAVGTSHASGFVRRSGPEQVHVRRESKAVDGTLRSEAACGQVEIYHGDIRFERKTKGPLAGKMVQFGA
ncbi:hypothetical protein B0T10DRAFT_551881 [Thelonectria olida]|uniref:Uncharacterized protein n=1 Tax=Thelonectria olida TaxID=1576542 RepID=A0A9P9AKP9_9HYPO|nr:hypothetical protein B0T10DRAFT_551881 [Thelonectria olida]